MLWLGWSVSRPRRASCDRCLPSVRAPLAHASAAASLERALHGCRRRCGLASDGLAMDARSDRGHYAGVFLLRHPDLQEEGGRHAGCLLLPRYERHVRSSGWSAHAKVPQCLLAVGHDRVGCRGVPQRPLTCVPARAGIGGFVGCILTGLFAEKHINPLGGDGAFFDNGTQKGKKLELKLQRRSEGRSMRRTESTRSRGRPVQRDRQGGGRGGGRRTLPMPCSAEGSVIDSVACTGGGLHLLGWQAAAATTTAVYSFVFTAVVLWVMSKVPFIGCAPAAAAELHVQTQTHVPCACKPHSIEYSSARGYHVRVHVRRRHAHAQTASE